MHLTEPVFLMTSDQDWAPNWAIESLLSATEGLPLHFFRTNPCAILDDAFSSGKITQGWHPNLFPNSSHGSSPEEVINYMKDNFPLCNTVRNHAFNTNTHFDRLLFEAGIRVDSQQATLWQSNLSPILDISGIIRLPVYFEDDVFFGHSSPLLNIGSILKNLFSPGLKIFNLHATFIGCNTPSKEHYEAYRNKIFESEIIPSEAIYRGRGSLNVFFELKNLIEKNEWKFQCFQKFANSILK